MKLKSIAGIATMMMACVGSANAGNMLFDPYVGAMAGFGGYTLFDGHDHTSQSSQIYGGVIGLDIPLFRFEAEYDYLNSDDLSGNLAMINAYIKAPNVLIRPYLGVGAGVLFSAKYDHIDIDTTAAYQAMAGITLDLPILPVKIDVEGRALYSPDVFHVNDAKPDLIQYDGRVKLRFIF